MTGAPFLYFGVVDHSRELFRQPRPPNAERFLPGGAAPRRWAKTCLNRNTYRQRPSAIAR